jgi:hypothetical protein
MLENILILEVFGGTTRMPLIIKMHHNSSCSSNSNLIEHCRVNLSIWEIGSSKIDD